jgi:hypothetical protein
VTEIYYPEVISTGYYLTAIAEGLAGEFDVRVICGQPNYAARGVKAPKHEHRNLVDVFRVWSTTLDKNVIPFRLINMLTLSLSMFVFAVRHFQKGRSRTGSNCTAQSSVHLCLGFDDKGCELYIAVA